MKMYRQGKGWVRAFLVALSALSWIAIATGCSFYTSDFAELIPDPPALTQAPPRISALSITPNSIPAGGESIITCTLYYEDWNEDVGPPQAELQIKYEVISGNCRMADPVKRIKGDVEGWGKTGTVTFKRSIYAPWNARCSLRLNVELYDLRGQASNTLSEVIFVGWE